MAQLQKVFIARHVLLLSSGGLPMKKISVMQTFGTQEVALQDI